MPDWFRYLISGVKAAAWVSDLVVGPDRRATKHPHSRPREDSPVPVSGWPYYLAGITIGGPVSDHGSHAGIKAAVRPAGAGTGRDLLETAHFAGFTVVASRIDRSRVRFDGLRIERQSIEFEPSGWRERARGDGVSVEAAVATVALDAFLYVIDVTNEGARPLTLRPRIELLDDPDPADEAQQPMRLSRGGRWRFAAGASGAMRVRYRRRTGPGPLSFDDTRFCRAIRASFGPLRAQVLRARLHAALRGERAIALAPGARASLHLVIGCGETDVEAAASLARGEAAVAEAGSPARALAAHRAGWARFLASLPAPPDLSTADRRTLDLAATGLRMSAFAPRGRMRGRTTAPSKIHFNLFALWDLAFHAIGLKEWDVALAKETVSFVLDAQRPSGILCYGVGPTFETLTPFIESVSQPPVIAIAVREVFEAEGESDRAWLAASYERLVRYMAWWERERDPERDGLFSYRNAFESGWDDTTRIPNPRVPAIRALGLDLANLSGLAPAHAVAPCDLNAWMFLFYENLAAIARHLGRVAEARAWDEKRSALGGRIEAVLWDDEVGAYLDREIAPDGTPGRFHRVITPAIAWPLFAGVARDRRRVARLVEGHILNPRELWGDPDDPRAPRFPIPTVAYDSATYNHAEDGYYWRGQVWMVPCWAVLVGLHRHGYADEAATLRARVLRLLSTACDGGLFENYDALTGAIGFGSGSLSGAGEPACFQIGLTTAVAALIVLRAHERFARVIYG